MDKTGAIDYINNVTWRESRLGLSRVVALLERIGNPQDALRYVHVAGTNGKGSVCAMLASVLTAAGYKTGLFTSPFITRFNERIQVDGEEISDADLATVTDYIRGEADAMEDHPTEFELVSVLAFEYFRRAGCDIVVLEVGLGGRLDATNVIQTPEAAVITAIDYDHTAELGNTLEAIAGEKGGIIKPGGDVVLYPQQPGPERIIEELCQTQSARLHKVDLGPIVPREDSLAGQVFDYGPLTGLRIPLLGSYQLANAAIVLTALQVLAARGWEISGEDLRQGLAAVRWPARFELVAQSPALIVDGGHNPQCVEALAGNLERYYPGRKFVFLTGVMADKDFSTMFAPVLGLAEAVFTVTPDNPRALPATELAEFFKQQGIAEVVACESVEAGVAAARARAGKDGIVCAFGSFYMAGQIRACFPSLEAK